MKEAKEGVIKLEAIGSTSEQSSADDEVEAEEASADGQVEEDFSLDQPGLIGAMLTFM